MKSIWIPSFNLYFKPIKFLIPTFSNKCTNLAPRKFESEFHFLIRSFPPKVVSSRWRSWLFPARFEALPSSKTRSGCPCSRTKHHWALSSHSDRPTISNGRMWGKAEKEWSSYFSEFQTFANFSCVGQLS